MQNRVYIDNLSQDVAASTLQELFEPYGFVMDVKMMKGNAAQETLGSALVTMATDESALAAIRALNGASLHGALIRVQTAEIQAPTLRARPGGQL